MCYAILKVLHRVARDRRAVHRFGQFATVEVAGHGMHAGQVSTGRREQAVVGQRTPVDQRSHRRPQHQRGERLAQPATVQALGRGRDADPLRVRG